MSGAPTIDQPERDLIERTGLARTLFVEAGAGTGKTHELVERVINLVIHEQVPLRNIAAITFTEAAGAELRDRIRQRLEVLIDEHADGPVRQACEVALADSDLASIGTLHSFALRILSEHPLEAGLPPRVEILDEVSSQLAFEDRWRTFLDELYDDPTAEAVILSAAVLGIPVEARQGSASLKDVAAIFSDNWDRLDPDEPDLGPLPAVDWSTLQAALEHLVGLLGDCHDPDDKLYARICDEIVPEVRHLLDQTDPYRRLDLLSRHADGWKPRHGRTSCWGNLAAAKEACHAVNDAATTVRSAAIDAVLARLRARLVTFTRAEATRRQRDGRLEFHDLLVLARELVRTSTTARADLHDRYQRLLLDEFQDTDPIQIEIAARIAGAVAGADPEHWADIPVESGRLFFVGDPKQSIYRFRRADITMFMRSRDAFAGGEAVPLVQNFRTVQPILAWVNHVFLEVMGEEIPDKQPQYRPLEAHRTGEPGDHRVVLLGGASDGLRAPELRQLEARDVARAIASIRDEPHHWPVQDEATGQWRDPVLSDVTVLLPTRTSLRQLEDALDDAGLPYRVDTGTLVYDTQEVRDVLAALRAIDDTTDAVALVTALRAPLYGCSDGDLFTYHQAGGRWSLRATPPVDLPADHPVIAALDHLRSLWEVRWWLEPSELMNRLLRERKAFALGLAHRRPREVWRRLRFLVDQAHLFEEAGGGSLRAFLAWAALQSNEGSRVHEPLLPETDDIAVSIKTVHGAKGLEFPITVVSGLTTQAGRARPGPQVHWEGNRPEIKFRKGVATDNFNRLSDLELEMDEHERQRLLYVACTRARDHLIVCTHHETKADCHGATLARHSAAVEDDLCRRLPDENADGDDPDTDGLATAEAAPDPPDPPDPPADDRAEWIARREALLTPQRHPRFASATAVAAMALDEEGLPDAGDEEEVADDDPEAGESGRPAFSRRRGRAGTAIGRAVHATLQVIDLATGEHLDQIAEQQAHAEAIPDLADTVADMARSGLQSDSVREALAGGRLWREIYVAAPVGTRAVEGYIDLLYETGDGLVIVDYKTDSVRSEAEIDAKLDRYRLQLATYAEALEATTGISVTAGRLVFCRRDGAVERDVAGLDGARAEVRHTLERQGA